jgi:hypothetical protein
MRTLIGHQPLSGKGIFWSGLVAGIIFMMLEMVMVMAFLGNSPWGPPRMIAAMVLGRDVLPPPATFSFAVMMVAMMIHFMLSWVYAFFFAWVFGGIKVATAIMIGAALGFVIYLVNFYGFTAIWPWFADARNWVSIFAHVMFGITLAWTYQVIANK